MLEEIEVEYNDVPPGAFLISGPLLPITKRSVRTVTDRAFKDTRAALAWAQETYPRVYRDESRPELGVWAFRVEPKSSKPSDLINASGGVVTEDE